jgi:hypothetical protein
MAPDGTDFLVGTEVFGNTRDPSVVGLDGAVAKSASRRSSNGKTTIMSGGVGVA